MSEEIDRTQVEALVQEGGRWVVVYCSGEQAAGVGAPLPSGVAEGVFSTAALRRYQRNKFAGKNRNRFQAIVHGNGQLILREGGRF